MTTFGTTGIAHALILFDYWAVLLLVVALNILLIINIRILFSRGVGLGLAIRLLHRLLLRGQEQFLELLADVRVHKVDLLIQHLHLLLHMFITDDDGAGSFARNNESRLVAIITLNHQPWSFEIIRIVIILEETVIWIECREALDEPFSRDL